MSKTVLILRGLPASGKSSYAKELVEKNANSWKRINMDDLRVMFDNKLVVSEGAEKFMKKMRDILIIEALKEGKNVVSDNTHLSPRSVEAIKQLVHKYNKDNNDDVQVTEKSFMDVPLAECIKRDLKRPNSVGHKVITQMYEQFIEKRCEPLIQNTELPKIYLSDIDGTVAQIRANGRSPFDWKRVGEDLPKVDVLNILRTLESAGYEIIFFSGRDAVCMEETKQWLNEHFGVDYKLFMRTEGDNRGDDIVKNEMFDAHIRDKYYVQAVFDDRDRVVKLWRHTIGLTCLQINYGDF